MTKEKTEQATIVWDGEDDLLRRITATADELERERRERAEDIQYLRGKHNQTKESLRPLLLYVEDRVPGILLGAGKAAGVFPGASVVRHGTRRSCDCTSSAAVRHRLHGDSDWAGTEVRAARHGTRCNLRFDPVVAFATVVLALSAAYLAPVIRKTLPDTPDAGQLMWVLAGDSEEAAKISEDGRCFGRLVDGGWQQDRSAFCDAMARPIVRSKKILVRKGGGR